MRQHAKLIIPAAILLLLLSFFFVDRPLAAWVSCLPPWVYRGSASISWIIDPNVQVIVWPLIFYLYAFACGKSTFRKELLFLVMAIPLVLLSIHILKFLLGRARPELWLHKEIYGFYSFGISRKYLSFPSAHAGAIGALMGSFSCFRPSLTWFFLLIALFLSFLRVLSHDHYLSDVWGGVFLAFYITHILYLQYVKTIKRNLLWKMF